MLQTQAVYADTLALLNKLMALPVLAPFELVGGTALALQIGHRISVDLDLFSSSDFNEDEVLEALLDLGETKPLNKQRNSLNVLVNEVKVDILKYRYPIIGEVAKEQGIRMLTAKDIAPMKLDAMAARGAKKDFIDIYFLLEKFSLKDMLTLHKEKYQSESQFHITRSLTYFADADRQAMPIMLREIDWEKVKESLEGKVRDFMMERK